jgi:enediyne biosynthesis protein E4
MCCRPAIFQKSYSMAKLGVFALLCRVFSQLLSCHPVDDKASGETLFVLQPAEKTGIDFVNRVEDGQDMNIFNYHNFYNGAGVAIGDINNDSKPDIFFVSNQHESKLYINKGNWQFEDVTARAGLGSRHKWHTGVSMADINGDGWLDIYVCNAGIMYGDDKSNELYINQKNGTFKELGHEYNLDDKGETTQAAFFDYDHDGDLDCFVLNNSHRSIESFGYNSKLRNLRDAQNGDKLYRNDNGKFTDVSAAAGIYGSEIGFGLGIAIGDVNNDGWEDMYVCNDFFERDYLYINQHDGTFKETINDAMGHISNGSMGCDMADINNDGWLDIFTAEMLPESDYRLKTTIRFDDYDVQQAKNLLDFHHQFTGNCLQVNNHDGHFSEIAQLAGIDATGWSWSALSFDFDNDGWKDMFVSNGLAKDLTNQDFLEYFSSRQMAGQMMQGKFDFNSLLKKIPSDPLVNYGFLNKDGLQFSNRSDSLGFSSAGFSNGAAYGDLDGDGDLDLVVNNVNSGASVYRNTISEKNQHHYLKIKLEGNAPNTFGIGARVNVYYDNRQQVLEQIPVRGFQSSVDPVLNIGLGATVKVDSLVVRWSNGKQQVLHDIKVDATVTLQQKNADCNAGLPAATPALHKDVTSSAITGNIRHRENDFVDFNNERLIPKMLSTEGPKLAVGDVNGDGLEDFYMGSAFADTAKLFIQLRNGVFAEKVQPAFISDKYFENTGAAFFDADNDGDIDLVLVAGGNQSKEGSPYLLARLYINDGKGNFARQTKGWPAVNINASCVRAIDFNSDGRQDIFIGARSIPGSYGMPPSGILLQNDGEGSFTDVTATVAPGLLKMGMVTDAKWGDIDGDGKGELVVVGDWMPVTIFKYNNDKFEKVNALPQSSGWWNCISIADINGDGSIDLVVGNNGLNTRIKASVGQPAKLYVNDFDRNGQVECIPVYFKTDGKAYPYYMKGEMEAAIPVLKKKFLQFSAYAGKSVEEVFTADQLQHATVLTSEEDRSCVFYNDGKGRFTKEPLPLMAQLSPVFGITVSDLNADGLQDIFMAGNFFGLKPQSGWWDAGYGTTLISDAAHQFHYMAPLQSGLFIKGEARDVASIKTTGGYCIVVAMNDKPLYIFRKSSAAR